MVKLYINNRSAFQTVFSGYESSGAGERYFSALKRVKNYLRSSLRQDKLTSVAPVSYTHLDVYKRQVYLFSILLSVL